MERETSITVIKIGVQKECSVCLDDIDENSQILLEECNHLFHKECLNRWITASSNSTPTYMCPLCRTPIYKPQEIEAYIREKNSDAITRLIFSIIFFRIVILFFAVIIIAMIIIFTSQ